MAIQKEYYIPRPAIKIFLTVCQTCSRKKSMNRKLVIKPITSNDFNERGQVDLIDFQSVPDRKYKWILNYQDHNTKCISLRPMESKRAIEVSTHLQSIFLTFGAPSILQSDNGREFVNCVIDELKQLWPECVIVHGRPRHPQSQGSIERANQDVEHMLRAWMQDNVSPYNALFGNDPKVGLTSSRLPNNFVKTITTEEEIEKIEEILQCSTVNYTCDICIIEINEVENQDEAGSIMCNLCRKKDQIKMHRKKGSDGIKKFAEKMLQTSHAAVLDFEVNDCVVMAVPKVDRGPTDPPNIICLVVEKKNKLYKLGTKHGMIKGWYGGDCLKKCETFLKSDEILLDKELTVRETVTVITEGQGFSSCSCKSKSPCQTSRCACFKKKVLCNSRCHNSQPCKNKE
ncbi:KRAB-A domain-containing protein 2-like, partial [Aphis craccivora]